MEQNQQTLNQNCIQSAPTEPTGKNKRKKPKKSKETSLLKNIIYNNFYLVLLVLVPLITTPYVSRVLQPSGVGVYSYTHSLVTYFTMFASLGTLSYGQREIARRRENKAEYSKVFWEIELITVASSLACLGVWLIFSFIYQIYTHYLLIFSLLILSSCFDISWFYAGLEKFQHTSFINSMFKVLSVILIFFFVREQSDVDKYILIYAGSLFLGSLSMWLFLPQNVCRAKIDRSSMRKHFQQTLVYFLPTVATSIYMVLDKSLIGIITGQSEFNGYYEQATRIINLAKTVSFMAIVGVVGSRTSYLYTKENQSQVKTEIAAYLNVALEMVCMLSVGFCFGILGTAANLVPMFFGSGYQPTVYLLYIFSPIIVIIALSFLLGELYYTPSGRRKNSTVYLLIGAGVNFVLNLIFIPLLQAYGAALASVIAELVITVLFLVKSNQTLTWQKVGQVLWKKAAAGGIMLVFLCISYLFTLPPLFLLIAQVTGGAAVYLITLILLRDNSMKEIWYILKRIFTRKKAKKE
ncbi:MAG: polysaccharide biosynthesis C-terminal domain-containing protein [Clostridia bacterium]|nr:polysaccharide biosynthesis C-terminal domain-containing protein [Clostridia bacterium]